MQAMTFTVPPHSRQGRQVRLGTEAPENVRVMREELAAGGRSSN